MIDTIILFGEVILAAIAAVCTVILYVHKSTNKIIDRLENTKLRNAIESNNQVLIEIRQELIVLSKQLAALNGR